MTQFPTLPSYSLTDTVIMAGIAKYFTKDCRNKNTHSTYEIETPACETDWGNFIFKKKSCFSFRLVLQTTFISQENLNYEKATNNVNTVSVLKVSCSMWFSHLGTHPYPFAKNKLHNNFYAQDGHYGRCEHADNKQRIDILSHWLHHALQCSERWKQGNAINAQRILGHFTIYTFHLHDCVHKQMRTRQFWFIRTIKQQGG